MDDEQPQGPKRTLGEWVSLAANVGVIVGLVFVGLEIRNGSNAVATETVDSIVSGYNANNELVISDPDFARVFVKGHKDPSSLDEVELARFSMFLRNVVNQGERVFELYKLGVLSDEKWNLYGGGLANMLESPAGRLFLEGNEVNPELRLALSELNPVRQDFYLTNQEENPPEQP